MPSTPSPEFRCIAGALTDEGRECQAFRSDDGELFSLDGATARGIVVARSVCGMGSQADG